MKRTPFCYSNPQGPTFTKTAKNVVVVKFALKMPRNYFTELTSKSCNNQGNYLLLPDFPEKNIRTEDSYIL